MKQYRDRTRKPADMQRHLTTWADELAAWETSRRAQIDNWQLTAPDGEVSTVQIGETWPDRHGIYRFDSALIETRPDDAPLELHLGFGGESLVRLMAADGRQLDAFSANPFHHRFAPIPAEPFVIVAEVAARTLFGVPNRHPVLDLARIVRVEPAVRQLRRRLEIIAETSACVADQELARALCECAEIALAQLRLPTATEVVGPRMADRVWARKIWERSFEPAACPAELDAAALDSVQRAITSLDDQLAELRGAYPKQGKVLVSGHAHIDYVWLWPQPETVRKITRTFNSVLSLMKAHPDFQFNQSSACFYQHIAEQDPAAFAEIKRRVREGRWEVIGGMFVECDTNMPSAEAFIRQFLLGQRFFETEFGQKSSVAWLPDTFGFTGAMPQIMRHMQIEKLVTIKVTWSETNRMPDNIFHWQGNDGSRVLVHTFDARENNGYNMHMQPAALEEVWRNHLCKDLSDTVIASYGWGDGGGGPDPDQIEAIPLLNLMPSLPQVRHGNIQTHLEKLAADLHGAALPVWTGELYLEYHRATLTTQARTKQLNRRAEYGLVAAEAISVMDALSGGDAAMPALMGQWQMLLRNQFHDILPGSSIREAYVQTEAELQDVTAAAEAIVDQRLTAIAARHQGATEGIAVANLSGTAKPHWQITSDTPLPASLSPQRHGARFVAALDRPLAPLSIGFAAAASTARVTAGDGLLENALVRVRLDDKGRITEMLDKRCGRDLVDGAANRLMLYRNDLPRTYDAWDIEPGFELNGAELDSFDSIEVTATGPHLGEITIIRSVGASRIVQKLCLWSNSARLDIVTDLDWHDRRSYLRAAFPLNVLAGEAVFDQAVGVTARATNDNTGWQRSQFESCGHRFVSLGEADWGGALLSADKYGFSAKNNVLTISLIRGPMYPDMLADEGRHSFTYSLLAHDGRWWSEQVQAEADLICDPLRMAPATADAPYDIAPVCWSGASLRLHALKPAEDRDGYVLRVSEAASRRGGVKLAFPQGRLPQRVDGLEQVIGSGESDGGESDGAGIDGAGIDTIRPFELVSVKF